MYMLLMLVVFGSKTEILLPQEKQSFGTYVPRRRSQGECFCQSLKIGPFSTARKSEAAVYTATMVRARTGKVWWTQRQLAVMTTDPGFPNF